MAKPATQKKVRVRFEGIKSGAWEHPADKAALKALQKVPGLDTALKTFFGSTTEKSLRLVALASSVRVTEKQFPRVHSLFQECCEILDVQTIPELYVAQNPFLNAGAVGMDKPFITLNSALVQTLDDEELLSVIAHEMGHVMSGHVLYKSLLVVMLRLSTIFANIPLSAITIAGLIAALKEWDRKSELSADRAGLITVQNPEVSIRLLMKMAGGSQVEEMDLGEFVKQAEEYEKGGTTMDQVYKILNLLGQTHPFPVLRVNELLKWVRSGEYDTILRGFYTKEDSELEDDLKNAGKSYSDDFKESFGATIKDVSESVKNTTRRARDMFDSMKN